MSTNKPIRTRFAPSPTGYVHIGSLRTALFSFLLARHNNGINILRVEDTDQNRLVTGALENLVEVLHNLGVEFDEGFYWDTESHTVKQRGDFGPYLQSDRLEIYQKYAQQLLDSKAAYYCYCSEQRLEELRTEQIALKKPPMYDRHCRNLSETDREDELKKCLDEGRKPVVRMSVPLEGETVIDDVIYGKITYKHAVLDDQIIVKSDGFPTYHLAVVVDDHLMEITHVIRGEEWLPSTPKHLLLYKAFGWEPTIFAHVPLILNPDKSKLSKRQGDVAIEDFLKKGYLKEALVNFVVFLGWNPKTEQEIFSIQDLINQFDLANINHSGAVFDINKLDWMNGKYIREKTDEELARLLLPYWVEAGLISFEPVDNSSPPASPRLQQGEQGRTIQCSFGTISVEYLAAIASLEKERLKKLSEIGERTAYFFTTPKYDATLLPWRKSTPEDAKEKLSFVKTLLSDLADTDFTKEVISEKIQSATTTNNFDTGSTLWPLRAALTGLHASPGPFEVIAALALGLGKAEVLKRIQTAISTL